MKKAIRKLGPFDEKQKFLNVIVETPKGSAIKYAYDPDHGLFALSKALPEGMVFPFNFGFIPGTKAEDGDPLDILILNPEPLFPGCLIHARLLGVIKAKQTEEGETVRNDRVVGAAILHQPAVSVEQPELTKRVRAEIENFFVSYHKLHGRKFKVIGKGGPNDAREIVRKLQKDA